MVSVVLDRLLRGYNSSAKDQMETMSFTWLCSNIGMEKTLLRNHIAALDEDGIYLAFYTQRILQGKQSLEELLLPVSHHNRNSVSGSNGMSQAARSLLQSMGGSPSTSPVKRVSHADMVNLSGSSNSNATGSSYGSKPLSVVYLQELQLHPPQVWDYAAMTYAITEPQALAHMANMSNVYGVACIAAACDWLVYRLSTVHNQTMRKAMISSHQQPHHVYSRGNSTNGVSSSNSNNGSGGSSSGRRPSTTGESLPSVNTRPVSMAGSSTSSSTTHQYEVQLKETVCLALKEVHKLSKTCLIYLRATAQIICFHYLQKLVNVNFNAAAGGLGLFSGGHSGGAGGGSGGGGNSSGSETMAEDGILGALMQQLHVFFDAVGGGYGVSVGGSSIVPVVIGPLMTLIPRLLLRCVTVIMSTTGPVSGGGAGGGVGGGAAVGPVAMQKTLPLNKTRLLRLIVSSQQLLVSFLQGKLGISDGESKRRLLEVLSEESERARRLTSLIESTASEVRTYFRKVFQELDKDTARALWSRASDRVGEGSFEEVWRDLEVSQAQTQATNRYSEANNNTVAGMVGGNNALSSNGNGNSVNGGNGGLNGGQKMTARRASRYM